MKTTTTTQNIENAQRLLDIRNKLKALKKEEAQLKDYFTHLLADDSNLLVNTAIMITRQERESSRYDVKTLDTYFMSNGLNSNDFKATSSYSILNVKAV